MITNAQVKFYTERARNTFIKLARYLEDLRPVWEEFIPFYQQDVIPGTWKTTGMVMEQSKWVPLTEKYRKWKERKYPGRPMLTLEGKLYAAATGGPGWFQELKKKEMTMGVDGEDYFYHVSERQKNPRKYFYTRNNTLPARAWAKLIKLTDERLQGADDDR